MQDFEADSADMLISDEKMLMTIKNLELKGEGIIQDAETNV